MGLVKDRKLVFGVGGSHREQKEKGFRKYSEALVLFWCLFLCGSEYPLGWAGCLAVAVGFEELRLDLRLNAGHPLIV